MAAVKRARATLKPQAGRAAPGSEWQPAAPLPTSAEAMHEARDPRPPTKSRYPIPNEKFEALKAAAPRIKIPKKAAVLSKDSMAKSEIVGTAAVAATLAPGLAPASAPAASANFAGMTATG